MIHRALSIMQSSIEPIELSGPAKSDGGFVLSATMLFVLGAVAALIAGAVISHFAWKDVNRPLHERGARRLFGRMRLTRAQRRVMCTLSRSSKVPLAQLILCPQAFDLAANHAREGQSVDMLRQYLHPNTNHET